MQGGRKKLPELGGWDEDGAPSYVTLAKAGGRKDLLRHKEYVCTSDAPQTYSKVDWFDHPTPPPPSPPRGYSGSTLLQWPTEGKASPQLKLPKVHEKRASEPVRGHQKGQNDHVKLPTLSDKHVDFDRLMSMDYQKEWLKQNQKKWAQVKQRNKAKRQAQKRRMIEHTMRARQIAGVDAPTESKPRFIMKKFADVPAKLQLPRLN